MWTDVVQHANAHLAVNVEMGQADNSCFTASALKLPRNVLVRFMPSAVEKAQLHLIYLIFYCQNIKSNP